MQKVRFRCLSCEQVFDHFPNRKWCSALDCEGQLVRVGQCFVCMQPRATNNQVVCSYCEPILLGLRKLLETRSESEDGGFALVEPDDMLSLSHLVYSILRAKWGTDADGDLPVGPRFVDRTRFGYFPGRPLPYTHKARTIDDFLNILRIAAANVTQTIKDYQDVQREIYDRVSDQLSVMGELEVMEDQ